MKFAERRPILAAILYNVIFGLAYIPLNYLTQALAGNTSHLLTFRFGVCWLVLGMLGRSGKIQLRPLRWLLPRSWPLCLMLILSSFFETVCLLYYPTGKAGVILALVPLFSTLFAIGIFKEIPSALQFVFIVMGFAGVALVNSGTQDTQATTLGFILSLLAAITTALLNITIRCSGSSLNAWETSYVMAFAVFLVHGMITVFHFAAQGDLAGLAAPLLNPKVLLSVFFLSVISSLYGNCLRNIVLTKISMAKASSFTGICTITSILAGVLLLGEHFELRYAVGSLLVLLGVFGVNHAKQKCLMS